MENQQQKAEVTHWEIKIPYDSELIRRVKELAGARWNPAARSWKVLATSANSQLIKELELGDYATIPIPVRKQANTTDQLDFSSHIGTTGCLCPEGDSSDIGDHKVAAFALKDVPVTQASSDIAAHLQRKPRVEIERRGKWLSIRLPYAKDEVDFLRSQPRSWWQKTEKVWLLPARPEVLTALHERYGVPDQPTYQSWLELLKQCVDPVIVTLYESPEFPRELLVKIKGYGADISWLKSLPDRAYDRDEQRWRLPKHPGLAEKITTYYQGRGAKVVDRVVTSNQYITKRRKAAEPNEQAYLLGKYPEELRPALKVYNDAQLRMHYSRSTIRQYISCYVRYLKWSGGHEAVKKAGENQVNDYLSSLARSGASDSQLHQAVNALKFYYQKVIFRPDFRIERIQRPRKSLKLPTILSVQEVDRLLRATNNLKHMTILYTLYSSGLRLAELLSVRLTDVQWERGQLVVREGKGRKDRVVMLSHQLKLLLQQYIEAYQPKGWLFNGQDNQSPYSSRSVQAVVRNCAKQAGIFKKVTPHTLRHCFATHLLDRGTDIRYIQELLGHKDIKTTLLYTHVTNQRLSSIVSPLDDLAGLEKRSFDTGL